PYDGVNLMPLIEGRMDERPRPIAFQFGTQVSLTDNRFKLVHNLSKKRPRSDNGTCPFSEWELYDLVNDPGETTNVASEHPRIVAQMRETLARWQESCRKSAEGADYR
ncbi:MAG: hypothetical protein D6741_14610, partial [Planctomycetota bacterium]